jgi:hypothetical protein
MGYCSNHVSCGPRARECNAGREGPLVMTGSYVADVLDGGGGADGGE